MNTREKFEQWWVRLALGRNTPDWYSHEGKAAAMAAWQAHPEFTALCHSKTRQIGKPVGYLVENEAGGLAVVHNLGRVTWLDDCVARPVEQEARTQKATVLEAERWKNIAHDQAETISELQELVHCQRPTSAVVPDDSKHHAVMQAQMWAQEARTQKAIVKQIGEIVGCANDWEMVEAVRDALSNASGGSLQDCCCGETEQAWRLCPLHSTPPKQEQES